MIRGRRGVDFPVVRIEIWSDVVCPWCYVGKRHLEQALDRFAHRDAVEIVWRAYELDPHAPLERPGSYPERIARKYGISEAQARASIARIVNTGADAGIDFRFDDLRAGNTFDAHRLLHLAGSLGLQNELKERLLFATFTEGHPIGDRETLVKLAGDVGVAESDARRVLEHDDFGRDVRDEEAEAMEMGATGVPFFVFNRRFAVSGAQPPETLLHVLERAWSEATPVEIIGDTDAACEDDTCEL
jgi:predicted DsbA family dithiol-disulfide isomerase